MLEELELDTEARLKAFTHPYRMKLLHALRELRQPATATDVARALREGPGKVHYHMRVLEAAGIVAVVRTETVNGIVARYFEPAARRFHVKAEALGAAGQARGDVGRMISRRFGEGLRLFLEGTMGAAAAGLAGEVREPVPGYGEDAGFLFELDLRCDAAEWAALRVDLEALSERYGMPAEGRTRRRLFVAGATGGPRLEADSAPPAAAGGAGASIGSAAGVAPFGLAFSASPRLKVLVPPSR